MAATGIQKVRYNHEAMINWLIENPDRTQGDAALYFGVSQCWLSQIINSDAFKLKLSKRQDEVFSLIANDVPAKLRGITSIAIDRLGEKIAKTENADYLLNATDKLLHRMGFAPASQRVAPTLSGSTVNNQTIVVNQGSLAEARQMLKDQSTPTPVEDAQIVNTLPAGGGEADG